MSKTTTNRPAVTAARTRAAVLAAGFGASMALGTGVAIAADAGHAQDLFAGDAAKLAAASTRGQADAQNAAVEAKKKAEQRAKEAKAKAARAEKRKAIEWWKPLYASQYKLGPDFGKGGSHWKHKHSGQDLAAKAGTNVMSVHGGTVVKAGGNGAGDGPAYGNAIVIKHAPGSYTQYGHLKSINVHPGQKVKTGQVIGKVGSTGNSTGPHLHFEVRKAADYGYAKDPVPAMRKAGVHL
ncbi:M23 family metallopeptidase [Streptomyces sp. ODS28]|uniref:M23 family metallopeptidase n=1 Tax=Streptomyces sp. ODS28 TaxID=3136688 RepID=UPI0031EB6D2F